jgi:hypothetical protein
MTKQPRHPFPRRTDRGSGMIMTILVTALVTALGATATALAVGNLRGSAAAQQAGTALDSAEAGIAQATTYIRSYGVRKLRCNLTTCTTNQWSRANPVAANVAGGGRWEAYIEPTGPAGTPTDPGTFLIHSTGTAGGPAQRVLETEVTVAPIDLPKAVFGRTINLGGTVDIQQMSVFSTGCIYKRSKLTVHNAAGLDLAYGVPAGVHSSQIITDSQGSGQYCPSTAKPIHNGLLASGLSLLPCNGSFPYDQDRFGGSLTGVLPALLPCAGAASNPAYGQHDYDLDGSLDVNGSFIKDDKAMFKSFGITRPALTDSELEQLRATAQAQGNYYTSTTYTVPTAPHSVLFFDLNGGSVDLNGLSSSLWARARLDAASPLCIDASLMVVIMGGDAKMNSNTQLAASIYLGSGAPYGRLSKANGTSNHVGMIYADTLDVTGNFGVSLDTCYLENPPPALFSVVPGTYRELDR